MDRVEKRELVSSLHQTFENVNLVVVTHQHGLSVSQVSALRRAMRDQGAQYKVAKNRLARLALDGTKFEGLKPMLEGPTALGWSQDPVAAAKVLVDFAKKSDKLTIVGGAFGETMLDPTGVEALANMPSLDESRANLVGLLQTPAQRIVTILQEPASQLARVLKAHADKDEAA